MKIYAFEFCPCKFESAFETVSLHFKIADAYMAMRKHRAEELNKWNEMLRVCGKRMHRGDKPCDDMLFRVKERTVT